MIGNNSLVLSAIRLVGYSCVSFSTKIVWKCQGVSWSKVMHTSGLEKIHGKFALWKIMYEFKKYSVPKLLLYMCFFMKGYLVKCPCMMDLPLNLRELWCSGEHWSSRRGWSVDVLSLAMLPPPASWLPCFRWRFLQNVKYFLWFVAV